MILIIENKNGKDLLGAVHQIDTSGLNLHALSNILDRGLSSFALPASSIDQWLLVSFVICKPVNL